MPSPERTPEGWSHVADAYDASVAPFLARFAEDALDAAGLRAGQRVLDVAAGTGALTFAAAQRGASVLAVDFAPGMVERLQARARAEKFDVEARLMDGQALDVPDASFDIAASNFGLVFFPDRARGFSELRRVLKPGGVGVVTGWAPLAQQEFHAAFAAALTRVAPDLPPPAETPAVFSLQDPDAFRAEMMGAGFRDFRVESVTHVRDMGTPAQAWDIMSRVSPGFSTLLTRVGAKRMPQLQEVFLGMLKMRPNGCKFASTAHIGVGKA